MTSIQNTKAKLQPLFYSHKDQQESDTDSNLFELYDDRGLVSPLNISLTTPTVNKSLQSLKAKLYQNVISPEGIMLSDDDGSEIPKQSVNRKSGFEFITPSNKRIPTLLRKFNTASSFSFSDQRLLKPSSSQNFVQTLTSIETKRRDSSEEISPQSERLLEDNILRPIDANRRKLGNSKKLGKHDIVIKEDQENRQNLVQETSRMEEQENQAFLKLEKGIIQDQNKENVGNDTLTKQLVPKKISASVKKDLKTKPNKIEIRNAAPTHKVVYHNQDFKSFAESSLRKTGRLDRSFDSKYTRDSRVFNREKIPDSKDKHHRINHSIRVSDAYKNSEQSVESLPKKWADSEIYRSVLREIQILPHDIDGISILIV